MSGPTPSATSADCNLLRWVQALVPKVQREGWLRYWRAELLHMRTLRPAHGRRDLALGLILDAAWLRSESLRIQSQGDAGWCLMLLAGVAILAAIPAVIIAGSLEAFIHSLAFWLPSFIFGSLLVVVASHLTSAIPVQTPALPLTLRIKSCVFYAGKIALLLPITFLLSADLAAPLHPTTSFFAFMVQSLLFALLALVALQWAILDGILRCKHCLRPLAEPIRVGRPSHNFLEWNGTELLCAEGHGLLSLPEIETSSSQPSRWLSQTHR